MKRNNMKPQNTNRKDRKFYWVIAAANLIYGGVVLLIFIYASYFFYSRTRFIPTSEMGNLTMPYRIARQATRFRPGLSVIALILTFIGSLISIASGVFLIRLLREKETKELKRDVIESMVTPDEKIVITELENNNGALTQSELVKNTGLSKVKVHRIVKRLESLGIIKKYPYGLTNKIKLERILDN
ncbi:MarR family transcriptional regulator [Candidatus Woesearchaeota archaeon]|nr:MarR family transcriptional regulator [Candidatus Woesearchaeota archaeon]